MLQQYAEGSSYGERTPEVAHSSTSCGGMDPPTRADTASSSYSAITYGSDYQAPQASTYSNSASTYKQPSYISPPYPVAPPAPPAYAPPAYAPQPPTSYAVAPVHRTPTYAAPAYAPAYASAPVYQAPTVSFRKGKFKGKGKGKGKGKAKG